MLDPKAILCAALAALAGTLLFAVGVAASNGEASPLRGPFLSDPELMERLDCPTSACDGPLSFRSLISRHNQIEGVAQGARGQNPFTLPEAQEIGAIVRSDLEDIGERNRVPVGRRLNADFLTDPNSRFELVGVVNRMDRQHTRVSAKARAARSALSTGSRTRTRRGVLVCRPRSMWCFPRRLVHSVVRRWRAGGSERWIRRQEAMPQRCLVAPARFGRFLKARSKELN